MASGLGGSSAEDFERRCALCGYRSRNPSFFRSEKIDLLSRAKSYCAGCQFRSPAERYGAAVMPPLFPRAWIVFAWIGLAILLPPPANALFLGFILSFIIRVAVHEFGHAAFARFANCGVDTIQIGSGPILKLFQWKKTKIELRLFFFSGGGGRTFPRARPGGSTTWGTALMILGGPLADAGLAVAAALAISYSDDRWVVAAAYGVFFPQLLAPLRSLWPSKAKDDDRVNDGRLLVNLLSGAIETRASAEAAMASRLAQESYLLTSQHRYADAIRHAEAAIRAHPHGSRVGHLFSQLLHSLAKSEGPRATVDYYLAHRQVLPADPEAPVDQRGWVDANVAWSAVLVGDPALLSLADDLSGRALEAQAERPEMQGTRGAVLVERGDHEKGIALLTEAVRCIQGQEDDRVNFVGFWAKGERALGNFEMAEELGRYQHYLLDRITPHT